MTKGNIYCECGDAKPHDNKPGCMRCRGMENQRRREESDRQRRR